LEAEDGIAALDLVRKESMDLLLMDLRMPRMDGIEAITEISKHNPAIPIVIMTAYSSIPSALEALKSVSSLLDQSRRTWTSRVDMQKRS
jgi:two-component system response regulator HydG